MMQVAVLTVLPAAVAFAAVSIPGALPITLRQAF